MKMQKKKKRFIAKGKFPDILEVSMLDPLNGSRINLFLGTQNRIHPKVVDLLKLDVAEVQKRPHFLEEAADLVSWINTASSHDGIVVFLAHNGARFDHRILKHHLEQTGMPIPPNWRFCDSLPLIKQLAPGMKKYNLGYLHKAFFGCEPPNFHHARDDVDALWNVIKKINGADDEEATKRVVNLCLSSCFGEAFKTIDEELDIPDFDYEFEIGLPAWNLD